MNVTIREKLHQQIDLLPDNLIEEIAKFTNYISANQKTVTEYSDWENKEWQEFCLEQFFSEDDDIEYFLEDAQEIY